MQRIFIIDDDELYQLVLKRTIKKLKNEVEITSYWNGEEALDAFVNIFMGGGELPTVVFLDINMPVLDGWQFLEGLGKIKPDIQNKLSLYLISTSLDVADKQKAMHSNMIKQFLTKPLSKETLEAILQRD